MQVRRCTIVLRLAGLVLVTALAACTAPPVRPVPTQGPVAAFRAHGFDGTYRGESAPDQIALACGGSPHDITIKVKGDRTWVHHGHPSLSGTIDATGQISMQDDDGTSSLTGSIQGEVLTATETASSAPGKLQGFYVDSGSSCSFTIQATREGGDGSG
jgi:hypothetical protein